MATIKIVSHKHILAITEWTDYVGDQPSLVKDYKEAAKRTVRAVFEIVDGEPMKKSTNAAVEMRPRLLTVQFSSLNGGMWFEDGTPEITGNNIKKDGSDGATAYVGIHYFPNWARELVRGDSPVLAWIKREYPR